MIFVKKDSEFQKKLLERFLKYVKIETTSDSTKADKKIIPSTQTQTDFAKILKEELIQTGLKNVTLTEHSYVYGILKATEGFKNSKSFCLISHLDTSEEVTAKNVNPQLIKEFFSQFSEKLENNDTIISTDKKTLLGADDKAGIAEIITSLEFIQQNKIEHGDIEVLFTPDEETGHGTDFAPLELIKSKHAYTVDGGNKGELETECFNAYSAEIIFSGKSTHTGTAKKEKMINAILMASKFIQNLPHNELPETTDGYDGFFAPLEITGSIEKAKINILLRDFTKDGIQKRIETIKKLAEFIEFSTGGKVESIFKEQYKNMKEKIQQNPEVVDILKKAYTASDIEPIFSPIRGGTDGSRLTELGIPTPNIFTGGHNFHSRYEWASLNQMTDALNVLINLAILHK